MSILVDILIALVLLLAAYYGTKRGGILIGLEFVCFMIAAAGGLWLYRPLGSWLTGYGLDRPLANVVAFTAIWVVIELTAAFAVRLLLLKRLNREVQLSQANQISGSFLNVLKFALLAALVLIVIAAVPLSRGAKAIITDSFLARTILASTAKLQTQLGAGLGQDLGNSLNFYTISSAPESSERINLGFTTTDVKVDQATEAGMLVLVNQERTSRGLDPLTINVDARTVARAYSIRMFAEGFFSHTDPDGHNPFQRLQAAGVTFTSAGENLALAPTLQLAHDGLMNSPGHRANILSPKYQRVGIGIIDGGKHGLMVTQAFTD